MSTESTDERALSIFSELITEILTDRGAEVPSIDESRALYAYDDEVEETLELDSLDALDLMYMLEERLGAKIPDDVDFEGIRTVGDLVALVRTAM